MWRFWRGGRGGHWPARDTLSRSPHLRPGTAGRRNWGRKRSPPSVEGKRPVRRGGLMPRMSAWRCATWRSSTTTRRGACGRGVSVEMAVRHGAVTLLSVIEGGGGTLALLCAEAESVAGPIMEIGNTNSRYRFPCGAREFVHRWNSHGPAHHCAVGVGHIADRIDKLGRLLGIDAVRVC